ncbi:phosphotransferase enzyme family protein [Bacillus horti]|uniref:Ser/Thr protein kinase RdoA (MazF antagonist) n=1 Tax=Caldalkalibacillus horti TaxID=77523 RepID=A0ABT9W0J2_9BACI|nr:phosphotransferase [Bacillus horti]MDQ0166777.1 Ser/Thr protein kinase RdoA (MazF antagonist) [Bacillus horti]
MSFHKEESLLKEKYNIHPISKLSLLHTGENQIMIVKGKKRAGRQIESNTYILKKYRVQRFDLLQIKAEIEWLLSLKPYLFISTPLKTADNEYVSMVVDASSTYYYVLFEYITGEHIENPTDEDYYKLGNKLSILHKKSLQITENRAKDWLGFNRPTYSKTSIITEATESLLKASFLTIEDKTRWEDLANRLTNLPTPFTTKEKSFVHGDVHFGNILQTITTEWCLLDFDECGFSHYSFDTGVPRLHLISSNQLQECWRSFIAGYNMPLEEAEIRMGTALRILYMAGKIPKRLDIEHLRTNPAKRIQKYFKYIEDEIDGVTYF